MADSVISALITDVLGRLTSAAIQEIGLLRRLEDDVSTLRDTFNQIQAVLHDAEEKQMKQKAVETWLLSLRSASLNMENVLNEVSTEAMLQKLHIKRGIKYRVRAFFSSDYNQLMVRARIAHKVKTIRKRLDAIASNRLKLNLTPNAVSVDAGVGCVIMPKRETSSLMHDSIVCGRVEEMDMVTQKICNKDLGGHDVDAVRIYVIWGMGGVGKTTLAQLVYNHEKVNQHFELKYWMYVSNKFEIKELIRGIIESVDKCECRLSQLDTMQLSLQKKLQKKRFLIVLDDVWIEENDRSEWEKLCKTLSCGEEGSIVLVTTRNQTTAHMMAKVPELQHKVGCLSEEDSWALFKKLAFVNIKEVETERELEPIGMEIVEKCKGLPLAVKTLAGLMLSKNSASEWKLVNDNVIWELQESEVLPALMLSYDNLLPHCKRCFAYCCLFPKGYIMSKDLLIELWMANDFIPRRREVDLYVLGEEIFNSLVSRSFFQDVKEQENMDAICKIHDLMHDLAGYVMRHDCSVIEPGNMFITPDEVLHLSSSCLDFHISDENSEKLQSLRSILIFANLYRGDIRQISNLLYVRVLYLGRIISGTLPPSICKLKHLRYLNISGSGIEILPESIIYLQNLQVLLLHSCWKLRRLPKGMRHMKNLQRLDIGYCQALEYMPAGIKELSSLRRLSNFVVGKKDGARIGELGDLNLLGWELELSGLENVSGLRDAQSANLKYKRNVLFLGLSWSGIYTRESNLETFARDEKVLEGLEPNSSLKQLSIENYIGKIISPSWMVVLLNLAVIEFSQCKNCEYIPPLGKLPNLRTIILYGMASLKCFHDDDTTTSEDDNLFPSLQELYINACSDLHSLPSNLSKLERLEIVICDRLVSLPGNLPELERLDIGFNYRLVSLPMNLPKLEVLHLQECKELLSLPSYLPNVKKLCIIGCDGISLPDEMQSFRGLKELQIYGCENLSRRCEKEIGEDWPKISHIPHIDIPGSW
ncbi:disease resistance protein, partial [Tanacetum coccineum]